MRKVDWWIRIVCFPFPVFLELWEINCSVWRPILLPCNHHAMAPVSWFSSRDPQPVLFLHYSTIDLIAELMVTLFAAVSREYWDDFLGIVWIFLISGKSWLSILTCIIAVSCKSLSRTFALRSCNCRVHWGRWWWVLFTVRFTVPASRFLAQ